MKATQLLHNLGQSLWLDNITRDLLNSDRHRSSISTITRSSSARRSKRSKKMTTHIAPLTNGKHGKPSPLTITSVRELHLRQLFAEDPKRGERLTAEAVGFISRLFEESHHRRDPEAALAACG